jgi:hypothetical protein
MHGAFACDVDPPWTGSRRSSERIENLDGCPRDGRPSLMVSVMIAVGAAMIVAVLVWWSSGRAKPDLRRRSVAAEIGMRESSAGMYGARDSGGPTPGSPGF